MIEIKLNKNYIATTGGEDYRAKFKNRIKSTQAVTKKATERKAWALRPESKLEIIRIWG